MRIGPRSVTFPPLFFFVGFSDVIGEPVVDGLVDEFREGSNEYPKGLSVNKTTGIISGNPTEVKQEGYISYDACYRGFCLNTFVNIAIIGKN